ncbi:MAG: TatD family hydrolase [Caldilineaceae bacterium]|nr:TatD family hydrolase [Caldilineaceae bacterium]MDE0462757.1 TatD family hydrolase [Caldilineaceae bacterium]
MTVPTLVDSHCHLDLEQFDADRAAVLERAQARGVSMIVNPGIDLLHCRQAIDLADRHPQVYAAVGIHPNSSADFSELTLDQLRGMVDHPKVVAIGEIGLDYHWGTVSRQQQAQAFRAQLELAAELGLPVIIHNREASTDLAGILQEWASSAQTRNSPLAEKTFWGVLHAFSGDAELAQAAHRWNFAIGLGGPVTFRNARALHQLVPHLELDRLMLETDAPWLTPHPFRGKRNEPAYVALVAGKLAEFLAVPVEEIAARTTAVALSMFQPLAGTIRPETVAVAAGRLL